MEQQKQPIQLLALDMDGTVLLEDKTISLRVQAALAAAVEKGVQVIPATGRAGNGVPAAFLAVAKSRYAITANGARVVDLQTDEVLMEDKMPLDLALQAFDLLQKYDCVLDLFQNSIGYSTEANFALYDRLFPENLREYVKSTRVVVPDLRAFAAQQHDGIDKWTMFFGNEKDRQQAWAEMEALGLEVASSLPRNMEINGPGVSKGKGLLFLAQHLGIPAECTMACGDGGNDLAMIRMAGIGVAMENGMQEVKDVADYVTVSNEEDGVAVAVEKFIL